MHKTSFALLLSLLWFPVSAQAVVYNVNRSFSDALLGGSSAATLTGTLGIPVGHFVIQNHSASPFTSVNLSLKVNATSYNLHNALTDLILDGGQFIIDATPTTLTFNTNSIYVADLAFSDHTDPSSHNRYGIGYDATPGFQAVYTDAGEAAAPLTFPVLFGTAVPEPSTFFLLGIGAISLLGFRTAKSRG